MSRVSLSNLGKRYASQIALKGVDLEIEPGELIVLVGPSGCGKSTLLRVVAGLEAPTEGEIRIGGKKVNDVPPARRGIGMVFQDYALYPHMTVRENIGFGLKMMGSPREVIQERVAETAQSLGLGELLERKPAQLSGGQRQRVAIGRALARRPSVLLLDEPLSNLDARLRAQTRLELAELHRRIRSTTIYVTHDQEEAMTLGDRVVLLNEGRIQQVGPPMELYRKPRNRFVASFLGSPRMNFLEGELRREAGRTLFEIREERLELPRSTEGVPPGRYLLGFRPEVWEWNREETRSMGPQLSAALEWVELHGHEVHVIARAGGERITLRTAELGGMAMFQSMAEGDRFSVVLRQEQLHWFEAWGDGVRVESGFRKAS